MSDAIRQPGPPVDEKSGTLFAGTNPEPQRRGLLWGAIGAAVVVLILAGVVLVHRQSAAGVPLNEVLPIDPYAVNVSFKQLAMSEAESLSGGKSTFLDGHVRNTGPNTLTSVTMQVLFKNDEGLAPTVETLPLTIIRTHEPYVDTELVSAAPLRPGDEVEFRLIFESVPTNWNQQMPELRVVRISKR